MKWGATRFAPEAEPAMTDPRPADPHLRPGPEVAWSRHRDAVALGLALLALAAAVWLALPAAR